MKLPSKPLFLSPLVRYTRYPFRVIAAEYGADVTITEMVNVKGVINHFKTKFNRNTHKLLFTDELEPFGGIQLFGSKPEEFGLASEYIEKETNHKFININLGCSKNKFTSEGYGAALLRELPKVKKIIKEIQQKSSLPVTLKTRLGWDKNISEKLTQFASNNNIEWMIIHSRYAKDNYRMKSRKDELTEIIQNTDLPIIANGDVFSYVDIDDYFERGAWGVAIGRWAKGNPFVFSKKRIPVKEIPKEEKLTTFRRLVELTERMFEREKFSNDSFQFIKIFALNLVKGLPNANEVKSNILKEKQLEKIELILSSFLSEEG